MPNWCTNKLIVRGTPDELRRFAAKGDETTNLHWKAEAFEADVKRSDYGGPLNFAAFIPLPEIAPTITYNGEGGDDKTSGYDWCTNNWGTKWHAGDEGHFDILERDEEHIKAGKLRYGFDTAWTPPKNVVEAMAEQFPTLHFLLKFREEDSFYGEIERCKNANIQRAEYLDRPEWLLDDDGEQLGDPTDEWWENEGDSARERLADLRDVQIKTGQLPN